MVPKTLKLSHSSKNYTSSSITCDIENKDV